MVTGATACGTNPTEVGQHVGVTLAAGGPTASIRHKRLATNRTLGWTALHTGVTSHRGIGP